MARHPTGSSRAPAGRGRRARGDTNTADSGAADATPELVTAAGELAWLEVIKKMDDVYHELLDYESALEQKNSELEDSQQFIRSVLSSISDVLVVCNRAGAIEDLNPSLVELTGRNEAGLRGSSCLELFADAASREVFSAHLAAHPGEALPDCELNMLGAGGAPVPVAISCTPRFSSTGRPMGLVITGRPVGELRRAYSELRSAHEVLKRTQQQLLHAEKMASLGRLVAGVAHELNNPISFVLGNVVVLKKYLARVGDYLAALHAGSSAPQMQQQREALRIDRLLADLPSLIEGTIEGAERTRDVVDNLKRFSAPGSDEHQAVDLLAVVERAVQWVAKSEDDGFKVHMQLPHALPVTGNSGQLQQVVMNLVQNAADATAGNVAGELTITGVIAGQLVELLFADNGPGVAPDNLAKLFDPFFTTKPVGKGTGLGLSISYGIIERHGGELSASNRPEGGAAFRLRLPLRTGP
jgi:two-component system sensor histidine kinase HupT/HoxJ